MSTKTYQLIDKHIQPANKSFEQLQLKDVFASKYYKANDEKKLMNKSKMQGIVAADFKRYLPLGVYSFHA